MQPCFVQAGRLRDAMLMYSPDMTKTGLASSRACDRRVARHSSAGARAALPLTSHWQLTSAPRSLPRSVAASERTCCAQPHPAVASAQQAGQLAPDADSMDAALANKFERLAQVAGATVHGLECLRGRGGRGLFAVATITEGAVLLEVPARVWRKALTMHARQRRDVGWQRSACAGFVLVACWSAHCARSWQEGEAELVQSNPRTACPHVLLPCFAR